MYDLPVSVVAGDPGMMVRAAARWADDSEAMLRSAGRIGDLSRLINWRCEGVHIVHLEDAAVTVARRWNDLGNLASSVAHRLRQADSDRLASMMSEGVKTAEDALWFSEHADIFESEIDDVAVAALGLFAIAANLDTARDRVETGDSDVDGDAIMSLEDLRAMAGSDLYSEQERLIAARVLEFVDDDDSLIDQLGLKGDSGFSWGDLASGALAVGSFVPVVGDVIDAGYALYYISQGDWANAGIHGVGLIPVPGVSGTGVRATREAIEELAEIGAKEGGRVVTQKVAAETLRNRVNAEVSEVAGEMVVDVTGNDQLGDLAELVTGVALEGVGGESRSAERLVQDHHGDFGRFTIEVGSHDNPIDVDDP
ncbi:MAG: hypothetical protein GY708_29560 [Actinomycetia bacterium]|nr:hypothetical protein [Actinomycetes bacterium]